MWGNYRRMSIERLTEEVKAQHQEHKMEQLFFVDALLNDTGGDQFAHSTVTPFAEEMIKYDQNIQFDCYLRVDKHSQIQEQTDLWRRGGLNRIRLGMESASRDILKVMHKGITPAQQGKTLECLSKSGVRTTTYWIVGHPHETESNFQETLEFIKEYKDCIYEADLAVFYFYGDGEVGKDKYTEEWGGLVERFPSKYDPLSVFKYYKPKVLEPSREVAFERAIRFTKLMEEIGVPCNRSSALDYLSAEKRWARLTQ